MIRDGLILALEIIKAGSPETKIAAPWKTAVRKHQISHSWRSLNIKARLATSEHGINSIQAQRMRRRRVTSESDIRLATERQRALLGSAKVKTDHLDIGPQSELCTEKVETLCRVFRKVGVNRYHQENHVEVLISRAMFERALEHCGIAANELCQKTPGEYPLLDFAGTPLKCLQGKHRVQAVRSFPSKEHWWIVDFYLDGDCLRIIIGQLLL